MPTADPTSTSPFEPASLFKRCAAFSYDLLVLVGLVASFTLLVVLLHGEAIAPGNLWFQFAVLASGGEVYGVQPLVVAWAPSSVLFLITIVAVARAR